MTNNKKFTLSLIILGIFVVITGSVLGYQEYKETSTDTASQNIKSGEQCIITIQGNQYDVTSFRKKHEGGDVFECGQDMTTAFQGAHKGYLPMIEKFKVN